MSESKERWTPGDWVADDYGVIFTAGEGRFMLGSFNMKRPNPSVGGLLENRANGRLAAAAPDLYEALAAFVRDGDGHDDFEDLWGPAKAALSRARGEGNV
jgi:hypothetical protein